MKLATSSFEALRFCLRWFFSVIRQDKKLQVSFFIAVSVFILALLFNVTLPLILKFIVQSLEDKINSPQMILVAVAGYGVMWTVAHIGEHIREMTSIRAVERSLSKLTSSFYETILSYTNPHMRLPSTGSIINKIWTFREGFNNLVWGVLFFLLPTILEILCACVILWYLYGVFYTYILMLTIGLYSTCTAFGISIYLKHQTEAYNQSSLVSGYLSDRLFNLETVNFLGIPKREVERLDQRLEELENKTIETKKIFETIRIVQGIIIGSALLLVTYHSVNKNILGQQGLSDFILINSYVIQFFTPLSSLGVILNNIYRSFAEVAGMIKLMESTAKERRTSGHLFPNSKMPGLSARDVCFSYELNNNSFSLKNINLSIKAGWKVGVVGPSGSGKSTLGKLLSGLYTPEEGEIYFNQTSFASYDHLGLKAVIGFAPQHVQIFDDTLIANILYANPNATKSALMMAIKAAQLNNLISMLPNGLNTILGEQGHTLSGGEKQRIGIARSIIKQPSLYILDEPTSFLDLKTEELILDYFRTIQKRTTQIIIAHRLYMIMDADWIIFMEGGQIKDQGPPERLIRTCQAFKELWELGKYEPEVPPSFYYNEEKQERVT